MNQTRETFISQLVADLPSGKQFWAERNQTLLWLLLSAAVATALTILAGPLRPGVAEQLMMVPRFLFETILGIVAIAATGVVAVRMAVPAGNGPRLTGFAVVAVILWLSNYVVGLYFPTMELGMLGKRAHCVWETLLYALPTMALGFWILGKGYVLNWTPAGFVIGLVAGFIPGHLMQLACMYDAHHILATHIAPVFAVGALGALMGFALQHRPKTG